MGLQASISQSVTRQVQVTKLAVSNQKARSISQKTRDFFIANGDQNVKIIAQAASYVFDQNPDDAHVAVQFSPVVAFELSSPQAQLYLTAIDVAIRRRSDGKALGLCEIQLQNNKLLGRVAKNPYPYLSSNFNIAFEQLFVHATNALNKSADPHIFDVFYDPIMLQETQLGQLQELLRNKMKETGAGRQPVFSKKDGMLSTIMIDVSQLPALQETFFGSAGSALFDALRLGGELGKEVPVPSELCLTKAQIPFVQFVVFGHMKQPLTLTPNYCGTQNVIKLKYVKMTPRDLEGLQTMYHQLRRHLGTSQALLFDHTHGNEHKFFGNVERIVSPPDSVPADVQQKALDRKKRRQDEKERKKRLEQAIKLFAKVQEDLLQSLHNAPRRQELTFHALTEPEATAVQPRLEILTNILRDTFTDFSAVELAQQTLSVRRVVTQMPRPAGAYIGHKDVIFGE